MKTKKKAFTLIELLIVIVIIGILATVAVVNYGGQSAKAKRAATISMLNNTINAANICIAGGGNIVDLTARGTGYIIGTDATTNLYAPLPSKNNLGKPICSDTKITSAVWPTGDTNGYDINSEGNRFNAAVSSKGQLAWSTAAGVTTLLGLSDFSGQSFEIKTSASTTMGITCTVNGCVATNP